MYSPNVHVKILTFLEKSGKWGCGSQYGPLRLSIASLEAIFDKIDIEILRVCQKCYVIDILYSNLCKFTKKKTTEVELQVPS